MHPPNIEAFQNIEALFFKHFDALEKVITTMEGVSMQLAEKGKRIRFIDRKNGAKKFVESLKALAKDFDYFQLLEAIRKKITAGEVIFEEHIEDGEQNFWRGYVCPDMKEKAEAIQVKKINAEEEVLEKRYKDIAVFPLEKFEAIAARFAKFYHLDNPPPQEASRTKKIACTPLPELVGHKAKKRNPKAEAILQEIETASHKQKLLEEKRKKAA